MEITMTNKKLITLSVILLILWNTRPGTCLRQRQPGGMLDERPS